jgi:hypothetical protein
VVKGGDEKVTKVREGKEGVEGTKVATERREKTMVGKEEGRTEGRKGRHEGRNKGTYSLGILNPL